MSLAEATDRDRDRFFGAGSLDDRLCHASFAALSIGTPAKNVSRAG
jgi:hypothetical protein